MKKKPTILTVAGYDPSGGAGVLADVKTFDRLRCFGMAVQTCNTIQTEDHFESVNWLPESEIKQQLKTLLNRYTFDGIKIGLVKSLEFLQDILSDLRAHNPKTIIVWDPVLSASAGFDFGHDLTKLNAVLKAVDWVTPNWNEALRLGQTEDVQEACKQLSEYTSIYLKGGHNEESPGKDFLWNNGEVRAFNPKPGIYYEKHGSGCVFSAALVANLVSGYPAQKAVLRTKRYMEHFLRSHQTKLGLHYG